MKNIFTIFMMITGLLVLSSCEDKLDLAPKSAIGDNGFYSNTEEVEAAVYAIYDGLQLAVQTEYALTEMRSDNTKTKSSEGEWAQFETLNVSTTNGTIALYWANMYNVIFRANKVLENLDVVDDSDLKKQFEGEAKFTRALAHFSLTRAFGDIPLLDKVILPADEEYLSKDPGADVLTFIANDLSEAINLLPAKSQTQYGRATSGAAKGLLAKVKLKQGAHADAKMLLDQLIADTEYGLLENYGDVFYTEMNSEVLFAIQYLNDDVIESQTFSYEFTQFGRNAGLNYITDDFDNFIDAADTERNAILYNPTNENEVGKFITTSSDDRYCGNDWIVLRLADVYLMHVEAILAGGESTTDLSAVNSYNAIRERAGVTELATDGSATLTKQMLLDERRVELAFENHRLYDLIRLGEAENVLGSFAAANGFTFDATKLLLPIPQREIDTSFGALEQNPGY